MQILKNNEIDKSQWDSLVRGNATGTWFQTPEAYEFFASMPELFQPFVVAVSKETSLSEAQHSISPSMQTLRAVCSGYVTVEKSPVKQFFTRRAIIIGGPALADDANSEEVGTLMKAVREQLQSKAIYIETRNFNSYEKWKSAFARAGFEYVPHLNFQVDCTDLDKMHERLSDNRKRQLRKSNISIIEAIDETQICGWYEILKNLYRTKVKTPLFSLSFFIRAFRLHIAKFMLAMYEGKIVGGSMVVLQKDKAVYEWFECGLNEKYKEQYPSVAVTYAGMKQAVENSIPRYDMMGAGEPGVPYGVRDFKAEFGGKKVEHGRFLHVTKPCLYKIGTWGVKILKRM